MALGRGKGRGEETRILDVTASMEGSLVFQEPVNLRISGQFHGSLETKGELTIGNQAVVEASITGEMITVEGRVTGKIVAKKLLKVVSPAAIRGEIWTPVLEVEAGAQIEGSLHMTERAPTLTLQEVAEYLEVEQRVVEQWVREGKVPSTQEGGQWRFEKAKIDSWVATQKSS